MNVLEEQERQRKHLRRRIDDELEGARRCFGDFHNYHEGYAVIKEEVDELWDAIKQRGTKGERLASEAIQIAAMAIRFVEDLLPDTIDRL